MASWRVARLVTATLWAALGAFLLWESISGVAEKTFGVIGLLSLFCVATAITMSLYWKVGKWLAVLGGVVVTLYALALVLFGSEDVGGFAVSLPIGGTLAVFGIWNFFGWAWNEGAAA